MRVADEQPGRPWIATIAARRTAALRAHLTLLARMGRGPLAVNLAVQTVAGLAPAALMVGTALALDAAVGHGGHLWAGVALVAASLVLQQLLAPVRVWLGDEAMRRVDTYASRRLMAAIGAVPDLRRLEDPAVVGDVRDALDPLAQGHSTPGDAVSGGLNLIARYLGLLAAATLLAVVASPAVGALGLAVAVLNRLGQTLGFSGWSAVMRRRAPQRQRLGYLQRLATDPRTARDVRQLRISGWLADRYRAESRRYLRPLWWARRRLLGGPFVRYAAATLVLGAALFWLGSRDLLDSGASPGAIAIWLQASSACLVFGVIFPESDTKMQYGLSAWYAIRRVEAALAAPAGAEETTPVATGTTPEVTGTAPEAAGTAPEVVGTDPEVVADALPGPRRAPVDTHPGDGDGDGPAAGRGPAAVVLDRIGYAYLPGTPVLDGVRLELARGRSTALVGVNGAGKSTLVKILAGLYRPTDGTVRIDGTPLGAADTRAWQDRVAILYQDYLPYQLSIRDNVRMQSRAPGADDALVTRCLDDVGLADVLARCPDGLDTPLSRLMPGGTDLSGGQWQRMALARALYAVRTGAGLLVLDEPTSQLDARGEAEFYERFLTLTHGVTSLIISHRFSSVRRADTIAVLDGGVITERGSHDDLAARGGTYARMLAVQAERYGV